MISNIPLFTKAPNRRRRASRLGSWMWRTFVKSSTPDPDSHEENNNAKEAFLEDLEVPAAEPIPSEPLRTITPVPRAKPPTGKPAEQESFPAIPDFLAAAQDPRSVKLVQQPSRAQVKPNQQPQKMAVFDHGAFGGAREAPQAPSIDGIEYPRAASWAAGTLTNLLSDDKGRQLFRCFLFDALAEENLNFLEAVDKLKKMRQNDEKQEIVDCYSPYVNLSSGAMQKIKTAAATDNPDPNEFAPACKEVRRLLENDQFPRFRRSECYLKYLEELLPRSYAEKWATSFEALLGNHVGRQYFRVFLRSIHAEENLRFWEAVVEFRATKNKSPAMLNLAKVILQSYLAEGQSNEVFLPFGVRQVIERKIADQEVDISLFDEAIKHIEQVLRNDPYVRFLQSKEYMDLLGRLH